jgi:hypothetical protein
LQNYAAAKHLPVDFLESLGLATVHVQGSPAVKMAYFDVDGAEIGARFRVALDGKHRFKCRKGTPVLPYGLWRLDRSLGSVILCEGKIRYETVEKTSQGLQPRLIERAGPPGLILTTTGANLHPENETRLLSLTVRDDPLQTAGVLNLICAHAILQQASRQRDPHGRIVATLDDYAAVYELVIDIISQGVQATVDSRIRDTVAAAKELDTPVDPGIGLSAIAKALGIDKSAASRRVRVAVEDGYLVNLDGSRRNGRPARITLGDPLPQERAVLPHPDALTSEWGGGGVLSPPATVQRCNGSAQATADDRAELEPWQQSIWEELSGKAMHDGECE